MKKYNNKTVADYIMGNDIEGFNVEDLEDNVEFMMDVMEKSFDKEMYHFCSDKVKYNPTFVIHVINLFHKDEEFITKIANEFLSKTNDNIARYEIWILMTKYLNKESKNYLYYAVMLFAFIKEKDVMIAGAKDLYKNDSEQLYIIGETGFSLLYDEFKQSEIIIKYLAEKAIEKVLHTDSVEFEDLLHRLFNSPQDLDNLNIKAYLIDYISHYDSSLASYASSHPEILSDTVNSIASIKMNWNTYEKRIDAKKYSKMFEYIHKYMEEKGNNCPYTEDELLYTIAKELGIEQEIYQHDPAMYTDDGLGEENLTDTIEIDSKVISFKTLAHYNALKYIISRFYNVNSLKSLEELEEEYSELSIEEQEENDEIDNMLAEFGLMDDEVPEGEPKKGEVPSNIIDIRSAIKK